MLSLGDVVEQMTLVLLLDGVHLRSEYHPTAGERYPVVSQSLGTILA